MLGRSSFTGCLALALTFLSIAPAAAAPQFVSRTSQTDTHGLAGQTTLGDDNVPVNGPTSGGARAGFGGSDDGDADTWAGSLGMTGDSATFHDYDATTGSFSRLTASGNSTGQLVGSPAVARAQVSIDTVFRFTTAQPFRLDATLSHTVVPTAGSTVVLAGVQSLTLSKADGSQTLLTLTLTDAQAGLPELTQSLVGIFEAGIDYRLFARTRIEMTHNTTTSGQSEVTGAYTADLQFLDAVPEPATAALLLPCVPLLARRRPL